MYDLIITGGGPAGLTATIYAIRKRLKVLLIADELGGKTNYQLELKDEEPHQVIRGVEVVNRFKRELEYLNFARHMELVKRIDKVDDYFVIQTDGEGELQARAVIIATGARTQHLNVPGEKELIGKGVGYSALSYAPVFLEKRAVVVGKGDLALRSAAELATVATHVHLVGPGTDLMATPLGKKLIAATNVTILERYQVKKVLGNGFATGVIVEGPDGNEMSIESDGTFVEMAVIPNSELVAHMVDCDVRGRIKVDSYGSTNIPGLFAAGDVTTTTEQVLVAVGEGAKAAITAYEYLLPTL